MSWPGTNDWLQAAPVVDDSYRWLNVGSGGNPVLLPTTEPVQFFRLVRSAALPPPTQLQLRLLTDTNGNSYFALSWNPVPGAAAYNLYMAAAPVNSGNYTNLPGGMVFPGISLVSADVPDAPGGVFTPALTPGLTYYFVVTAVSTACAMASIPVQAVTRGGCETVSSGSSRAIRASTLLSRQAIF